MYLSANTHTNHFTQPNQPEGAEVGVLPLPDCISSFPIFHLTKMLQNVLVDDYFYHFQMIISLKLYAI